MSVQSRLNEIWYGGARPPRWLLPLSAIYGVASRLRRLGYAKHWRRSTPLTRPVIVVGNLSVGGTGKTPLVCWLAVRFAGLGFRPGIVTRGYGGSSRRAQLVQASDDSNTVGDEAIMLARRTGVPIAIGRDRPAAAQLLINAGCDLIVSDDGLQHYALVRDCEIIVVDGERRFGNGRLLPAGPLREVPRRLLEADAVVVNFRVNPCTRSLPSAIRSDFSRCCSRWASTSLRTRCRTTRDCEPTIFPSRMIFRCS
jgi:tetraacyldisaccharide 4'-kinase